MSDISDYYSNSDSDSDVSEIETPVKKMKPQLSFTKPKNNIQGYENDSDNEESENEQEGGASEDDELENDESNENNSTNEDSDESENDEKEDDDDDISINEEGEIVTNTKNKALKTPKSKKSKVVIEPEFDDDEDEDEEDDDDEKYLQKFDNELTKNYIASFHPECMNHNFDEIIKMTKIVKDNDGIIIDPLHKTVPYLTKYEKARIIGQRAKQIETGSKPFVKVPEHVIDGYVIAELELQQKKIPFIIRRPLPGGGSEYWNLRDLENIGF